VKGLDRSAAPRVTFANLTPDDRPALGFVGCGNVGGRQVANFLERGYPVCVYDLDSERVARLQSLGARAASNCAEVAARSEIVFTSLPTPADVATVALEGEDSLARGLRPGSVYIDITTNSPETVANLAAAMEDLDVAMLDAPFNDCPVGACSEEGMGLALLVSGEMATFDRVRALLQLMADRVLYCGELGKATQCKLIHNAVNAAAVQAVSEGITLGLASGIDLETIWDALRFGAFGQNAGDIHGLPHYWFSRRCDDRSEHPAFTIELLHKDLQLVRDLARQRDVSVPLLDLTVRDYEEAKRRGWSEYATTKVRCLQEDRARAIAQFDGRDPTDAPLPQNADAALAEETGGSERDDFDDGEGGDRDDSDANQGSRTGDDDNSDNGDRGSAAAARPESSASSKQERTRALFALAAGLIAVSLAPILIRLSEVQVSPYATVFHRSWIATLMFVSLAAFSRRTGRKPAAIASGNWRNTAGLLLLLGITFTAAVVTWAWALTETTIANSSLLHSFTPAFTGLFAWLFWQQRFGSSFWVGMTIAMGGAIMLGWEDASFNSEHLWGDGASLLSAVFFSTETLLVERLRQRLATDVILAWCCGMITCFTLPLLWLFPDRVIPTSIQGWLAIFALAAICQVLGHGLLTFCLKYTSAGIVSLSHLLVPLLSAGIAWPVFNEPLTLPTAIAFAVVTGGIALSIAGSPSGCETPEQAAASAVDSSFTSS